MKRMIFLALLTGLPPMPVVAQDPHAGHVMPPPKPPAEEREPERRSPSETRRRLHP
jgi:hypothetical protein